MAKILVVEPQQEMHEHFSALLESLGHTVEFSSNANEAMAACKKAKPEVLISDFGLAGEDGLDLIRKLRNNDAKLPAILMNAVPDKQNAIAALRAGVVDYLRKPIRVHELSAAIDRALGEDIVISSNGAGGSNGLNFFAGKRCFVLVGDSKTTKALAKQVDTIVNRDNLRLVFMQGEPGSGKEILARAIYHNSSYGSGEFVVYDCAAEDEKDFKKQILGSEDQGGSLFSKVSNGALFLKHIDQLSVDSQTRLANLIDGNKRNLLTIVSSDQDVDTLISEGEFSEKLYYKVALEILQVPSLRDRTEDVPKLVEYVVKNNPEKGVSHSLEFSDDLIEYLQSLDWERNLDEFVEVVRSLIRKEENGRVTLAQVEI